MKQIEEELVTLNSKTPCLSEDTEAINEISVKLPSQLIISKITTYFDINFDPLIMNSRIEVAKFEPVPTLKMTIHDIKDNHLKIISSATINISAITLFDENFRKLSMNSSIEVSKFEPEPTFEKTNNETKENHLKSIASVSMNLSAITLLDDNLETLIMNNNFQASKFEPETKFDKTITETKANNLKIITSIEMNVSDITSNKHSSYYEYLKSNLMPSIILLSPVK